MLTVLFVILGLIAQLLIAYHFFANGYIFGWMAGRTNEPKKRPLSVRVYDVIEVNGGAYPLEIYRTLKSDYRFLSIGAIYNHLDSLLKSGCIAKREEEGDASRGFRKRVFYYVKEERGQP